MKMKGLFWEMEEDEWGDDKEGATNVDVTFFNMSLVVIYMGILAVIVIGIMYLLGIGLK